MSLDITLYGEEVTEICTCDKCDHKHEHTYNLEVYSDNITHNLGEMASKAGIYSLLWKPEELNITKANDIIVPLRIGLDKLLDDPVYFKYFNPANGWGRYETLVLFVKNYLKACIEHPESTISICR